ncbi:MAG: hypothetical protein A3B38_03400 [Candidatus Levybacteria bacterium RIFCSPLOWO2_01_FULL_36_13]|nr:MAG: hypothetical protein A2684_04345 [Candidatus Levybacteria bacterium RIFCSPHIGHO2_01_FULL_36_15b]OGH34724.1 MAG: hypothetical protein A3B38_03400 [Candidatus Levybacteria bacterium RIFCSPLOWO2_01_FULL_36_13]
MDNFTKLLNKTYRFLSYRQRSIKEVDDYLAKKKASSLDSKRIINKLKEQKFLDDFEFAKWWIEQRSKIKPKAHRIIKFELKQKGIDKELIEDLFEDGEDLKSDLEKALDLAGRKIARYKNLDRQKIYEKMGRFLASKGFDWDTIKKVVDQLIPRDYNK